MHLHALWLMHALMAKCHPFWSIISDLATLYWAGVARPWRWRCAAVGIVPSPMVVDMRLSELERCGDISVFHMDRLEVSPLTLTIYSVHMIGQIGWSTDVLSLAGVGHKNLYEIEKIVFAIVPRPFFRRSSTERLLRTKNWKSRLTFFICAALGV